MHKNIMPFNILQQKVVTFLRKHNKYLVVCILLTIFNILFAPHNSGVNKNRKSPIAKWSWYNSALIDTALNRGYQVNELDEISIEFIQPQVMNCQAQELQSIIDKLGSSKDISLEQKEHRTIVHLI